MTYRNRKLLDLAHDAPCCAEFDHQCAQPHEPLSDGVCVPAHSNRLAHGRGAGHRAADIFHAAVCPEAHDYIDGRKGGWDRETKHAEWNRAYIKTQLYYWENGKVTC